MLFPIKHGWPLLAIFLLLPGVAPAQEIRYDRIDFEDNPDWETAVQQARESGKLLFLDAYTVWCGPCKRMEKEVFTRPQVANYFNQKFVNVKYDMERPAGMALKEAFGVQVYPTYLFVRPDGQVVHRIVGAHTKGDAFFDSAKLADSPTQSLSALEQRYRNGERNPPMMLQYLQALRMAGELAKEAETARSYLALMSKDHFMDSTYWGAAKQFIRDPASREFRILLDNRHEIAAAIGTDEVEGKIYEVLNAQIEHNTTYVPTEGAPFDKKAEEQLVQLLRQGDFARRSELLARALAASFARNGDWYDLAFLMDNVLDFRLLDDYSGKWETLHRSALLISKSALDEALLRKALRWSELASQNEPDAEKKAIFLKTNQLLQAQLTTDSAKKG